jgi:hypothetical protein
MAVFDIIGTLLTYVIALAFISIIGYFVLKIGFTSFKMSINSLKAVRNIEYFEEPTKNNKFMISKEEKNEFEIISDIIKNETENNPYINWLYKSFKIDILIAYIDNLWNSVTFKLEKSYNDILNEKLKINLVIERTDSLKDEIKSKFKKSNHAKYAYIQLFKK